MTERREDMLFHIVTQTVAGAIAGYITNKYAINMLFKKYGPFGGVVQKNKDNIIEQISILVEEEVIHAEALLPKIKEETFRVHLEGILEHFFQTSLKSKSDYIKIKDVPGYEEAVYGIKNILEASLQEHFEEVLDTFAEKIETLCVQEKENFEENIRQIFSTEDMILLAKSVQKKWDEEKISVLLGESNEKNIVSFLSHSIKRFLHSSKGEETIKVLCTEFFAQLAKTDSYLYQLLPKMEEEACKTWVNKYGKEIWLLIDQWLEDNGASLNEMFNETIKKAAKDNPKDQMVLGLGGLFSSDFASSLGIVEKLRGYVKESLEDGKWGDLIWKLLAETKVCEIGNNLTEKNKDNELSDFIRKYLLEHMDLLVEKLWNSVSQKSLGECIPIDFIELYKKREDEIWKFLLQPDGWIEKGCSVVSDFARSKKGTLVGRRQEILQMLLGYVEEKFREQAEHTLPELLSPIFKEEAVMKRWSKGIQGIIEEQLGSLIKGRIQTAIFEQLKEKDVEEVADLVQTFFGTELKPLALFGGCLGGIFGLVLGFFFRESYYGFPVSPIALLLSMGVMGTVGWLTNVIALRMLFRPYKEIRWMSKIPILKWVSFGYIPKNKPKVAENIAKFISEELVDHKKIQELFTVNKRKIKAGFTSAAKEKEDEMTAALLEEKENISGKISTFFWKLVKKNKTNLPIKKIANQFFIQCIPALEEPYAQFQQKRVADILGDEPIAVLKEQLMQKTVQSLQSPVMGELLEKVIIDQLLKGMEENTEAILLGELWGGKVKELAEEEKDKILAWCIKMISELLQKKEPDMIEAVLHIKNANPLLGFAVRDELIQNTVSLLCQENIPLYLEERKENIEQLMDEIKSEIFSLEREYLPCCIEEWKLQLPLQMFMEKISQNQAVLQIVREGEEELLSNFLGQYIQTYTNLFGVSYISVLYYRFSDLFLEGMSHVLERGIEVIEIQKTFMPLSQKMAADLITKACEKNMAFLPEQTKELMIKTVIYSLVDAVEKNFASFIRDLEIEDVAREQIEKMEPKKIHAFFERLGGIYFTRLEQYGWMGAICGIHAGIGPLVWIIDFIFTYKNEATRKQNVYFNEKE